MRKPLGLFVAAFATVAGGAAAAQVGDPSTSTTDSTTTTTESTTSTSESTSTTEATTTTIELADPASTEADTLVEEGDGGEHGAWVSDHAQNICNDPATVNPETGEAFRNHGECVSAAARDKDHDGTPDVPAEDEAVEETEDVEVETEDGEPGAGHRTSDGAGHRDDSPGRGHERFDG